MIIPIEHIIEIGLMRKKNVCAKCGRKIDLDNHNIQLCKKCRLEHLETLQQLNLEETTMDEAEQKKHEFMMRERAKAYDRVKVIAVAGWCAFAITLFMAIGYLRFIN